MSGFGDTYASWVSNAGSPVSQPFLRPRALALVALGGTLGAATREVLVLTVPDAGHLPWAIMVANVAGAFLLGLLYSALNRHDAQGIRAPRIPGNSAPVSLRRSRRLRLLLGTGFCGGFTTYSTLAVGVVLLSDSSGMVWAGAYALGTVFAGALATWTGIAIGSGALGIGEQRPSSIPVREQQSQDPRAQPQGLQAEESQMGRLQDGGQGGQEL